MMRTKYMRVGLFRSLIVGFGITVSNPYAHAESQQVNDDPAAVAAEVDGEQPAVVPGTASEQVAETHQVQSGDTLWDLCQRYLSSPWYWPKVWSYNPHINNAHWIYPGNQIRFMAGDKQLPTAMEVARNATMDDEAIPEAVNDTDLVRMVGGFQTGQMGKNSAYMTYIGFLSKTEQHRSGQIQSAFNEAVLLDDFDRVYLSMSDAPKLNEPYMVYRVIREIQHPVTGADLGYAVEVVGSLSIVAQGQGNIVTGQIIQAYRPIERGDFVGPVPESLKSRVEKVANSAEAQGYIVDTLGEPNAALGEHHVVFVDMGQNQGVQRGNTLSVITRGDRYTLETEGLPDETIGELMIIDVKENTSTALIIGALFELTPGDRVEMRRASTAQLN